MAVKSEAAQPTTSTDRIEKRVMLRAPRSRVWRDGTPMPTPRGALAVAVVDGKINAIGGHVADASALSPHEQ